MIAKLSLLSHVPLLIPQGQELRSHSFEMEGVQVTILPPAQAALSAAALANLSPDAFREIVENVKPASAPAYDPTVLINDAPVLKANLLQIIFKKNEFDRRRMDDVHDVTTRAEVRFMFETLNRFLHRVRTVTQAHHLKEISPYEAIWRIDYLTDEAKELASDPKLFRMLRAVGSRTIFCGITADTWEAINSLRPDFKTTTYDTIFLDARAMVPDWGAAIVLAFTALETLISTSLEFLQNTNHTFAPEFWTWLTEREGDYRKEPGVAEEFNHILKQLTGKSLKDDGALWQQFNELKTARNNYIHNGLLALGRKPSYQMISPERAQELVESAGKIIAYVESILPTETRRQMSNETPLNWTWRRSFSLVIPQPEQLSGASAPASSTPPAASDTES